MRTLGIAIMGTALALSAGAGFWLGRTPRAERPRFEESYVDLAAEYTSFSEVENTKATLNALAEQFILNLRASRAAQLLSGGARLGERARTMRALLAARAEFKGAAAEGLVTREMLCILRQAGEHRRWLDVYLDFLYSRPKDPIVGELASEAYAAAAMCSQGQRLERAFEFVELAPGESVAKEQVRAARACSLPACIPSGPTSEIEM